MHRHICQTSQERFSTSGTTSVFCVFMSMGIDPTLIKETFFFSYLVSGCKTVCFYVKIMFGVTLKLIRGLYSSVSPLQLFTAELLTAEMTSTWAQNIILLNITLCMHLNISQNNLSHSSLLLICSFTCRFCTNIVYQSRQNLLTSTQWRCCGVVCYLGVRVHVAIICSYRCEHHLLVPSLCQNSRWKVS